ncbi:hypothetical protein G6F37_005275 [Rhizopus arrhizus]|nr:hypothetical protein G6F38_005387 [Rhizopus arrhizus]KAG1159018.1 hypothetical protein G6F37_005275 [Rhizopus arrhizus]
MTPNIQQKPLLNQTSFVGNFWSKDDSGMNQLLDYIKSTHDDLDIIHSIYKKRADLENEFGEKLLALSTAQELDEPAEDGVAGAYQAIAVELRKTAESHLELSKKLKEEVSNELEAKLQDYRSLFDKWDKMLHKVYLTRQERTVELLKIRAQYLKEHDASKGQSNQMMKKLREQYKMLVEEVNELSQEWIETWTEACETIEAMEEDRVEFIKGNVWEYANLASAKLLIQDEWCEVIRTQLEKCSAEEEIEKCISNYGTGAKIPTTNDYVGEVMKEFKRKQSAQQALEDKNQMMEGTIRYKISDNMGSTASRGQIKRKPLNKSLIEKATINQQIKEQKEPDDIPTTKEKPKSIEAVLNSLESQKGTKDRDFHRRQPSEYKPDTGSLPIRRGQRTLQQIIDAPEQAPKSPRPISQTIQNEDYNNNSKTMIQQQQQQQQQQQPLNQSSNFSQHPQFQPYNTQSQQQYAAVDQRSPMMQPQRSPMMQPQHSPMIQPQAMMMQVPVSPMMQPQRSPIMAPQASPNMQPYQRSIPPPITIPNYVAPSPQPSPAMIYGSSPIVRWPTTFIDGRPIISWARSKYDYKPTDPTEIPLTKNCLVGVLESDLSEESWWIGAVWDEYHQAWSNAGSVPGNFMVKL